MIFTNPWFLLLSLLAFVPWLGPFRGRNRVQSALRSTLFLVLAFALSQPQLVMEQTDTHRILIVDRSASMPNPRELPTEQLSEFATDNGVQVITLGADENEVTSSKDFGSVWPISATKRLGETPLTAALSKAQSLVPAGESGCIWIASDGLATNFDDTHVTSSLHQRGIPLHWIRVKSRPRECKLLSVRWPNELRQGITSSIEVQVLNATGANSQLTLQLPGQDEISTEVPPAPRDSVVDLRLEFEPQTSGYVEATLILSANAKEDKLSVLLPILKPYEILYLGSPQSTAAQPLQDMLGNSFLVKSLASTDTDSISETLQTTDLVWLDDLPAKELAESTEREILDQVQAQGVGLFVSGGRASFGAGGWHNRPVEELLPIEFVQKEEKRDPSTSLVIVIDTSGSMTGVRVQLAKEVARLAMRRLLPHDKVGIVEFYGAKRWAAPLQPASNAIELQRALNRMDAGGGTVILPALEEAFYGLQNVDTRYKHVLVLTDGGVESGDFESLMRRMAKEGINVSTVLAGGGYHSEFLVNIANWGKGRFYNVPDRFNLPEILLKQPSTTKLPAYRPGIHSVRARGGSGWWGDVDVAPIPELEGYVESKARLGSEVLLETARERHPILTTWRFGLGRVTTLGSEPFGAGTQRWQDWPEYGQALSRILQRCSADARSIFRFTIEHDGGEIVLQAHRQTPRTQIASLPLARELSAQDSIAEATSKGRAVNFVQRSPDHFLARFPAPDLGERLRLATTSTTYPEEWQPLVVDSGTVAESRVAPTEADKLSRLVTKLGGSEYLPDDDWAAAPVPAPEGIRLFHLAPVLFAICLVLFFAEIIRRRLPQRALRQTPGTDTQSGSRSLTAAVWLLSVLSHLPFVQAQSTSLGEKTFQVIEHLVSSQSSEGISRQDVNAVFDQAVLSEGTVEPVLNWLANQRGEIESPRGQVLAELEVHLASRLGELARASMVLEQLLESEKMQARSDLRIWQAKLEDALGNVDNAKELYGALAASEDLSEPDQQLVRLRLALMDLVGSPASNGQSVASSAKPLIELAEDSEDIAFRNRAANVLAVQNKHAEALKLFTIQGEGTERFRSSSRVAEWAIRARKWDQAIESAWTAVDSAELKRDRNYALALLVEAYRLKDKEKGLRTLVGEFQKRMDSDSVLSDEMRQVWIALLRELGNYDKAIELFKASATRGFSVEMRRELLEMEGEAGYEQRMLESYRELIRTEPKELTWRAGLTQLLLEKGQDEEAEELWSDFIEQLESGSTLLQAAQILGEFGMDELCQKTIERMVQQRTLHGQGLLYWSELQSRRGDVDAAEQTLDRLHGFEEVDDEVLAELASAYERIGRQDKAIEVNEAIRAKRTTVAEDLEMRLAWLYSEVGDEEQALEQWLALWEKITSIPRRRYVEVRLMTVASRLGTLADIAIDIEEKLADGTANDREAGLLVRIYSRVNDAVAATEISEEYMSQSGKNEVEQLQEKGRIYQICNDYWNYEKVVERLIEVDPEGKTEYLRQLALSMLERGKAQEAREVLMTLRGADDGQDSIGGEFEAGVLSLVGMNREAAEAYRKGIANHPDRIESYLLLANLLKEMGLTDRAVGMFQYLAENTERDDLFTIAIDGILNMEARGPAMQWARRITLERLADREDKNYLYQLLADLSFEVNDRVGQIRALENSLAVSGTRRLSVLRECMELSSRIRGGVYYSSSSRGPTNKGNAAFFAFGRRLIGLGELMPPQVFLDLGQAFLDDGDTPSAERTFAMARNLADPRSYQREVAQIFEKSGKTAEALARYDRLLRTSPSDVALIARVAKLNEQEGKDQIAFRFYLRGMNLLLAQTPLTTQEESSSSNVSYWSSNRDAYQTYSQELLQGILVTAPQGEATQLIQRQLETLRAEVADLKRVAEQGRIAEKLADSPRLEKRSDLTRSLCFAFEAMDKLEDLDAMLVHTFEKESDLIVRLAQHRIARGRFDSVESTLAKLQPAEEQRNELEQLLGIHQRSELPEKISPPEMWRRLIPAWIEDDRDAALSVLRRVDQRQGRSPGTGIRYVIINGMAVAQSSGLASDITAWMRLAKSLGDEGLALQFARSQAKSGNRYSGPQFRQQLDTFREILSPPAYGDLVRYTFNLIQDDKNRVADYLWLLKKEREHLEDQIPEDEELLERIEDGQLEIGYYFPFALAMEVFPESIRAEALAAVMGSIVDKYRPRELVQVPFAAEQAVDEATVEVVLEWMESGIEPALQDDYLRYCTYSLPRSGTALRCGENAEFALKALKLLQSDRIRQQDEMVPRIAEYVKAVVLHQSGRTDEAIAIVLDAYNPEETISDYYLRNAQAWAHSELIPIATAQFIRKLEESQEGPTNTVAVTDKKIALATMAKNEDLLRETYLQAIEDHPEQSKYQTALERWEQQQNRPLAVIDFFEQQRSKLQQSLETAQSKEDKAKAQQMKSKIGGLESKLAGLYRSVNHFPKALRYLKIGDDLDIERFEKEQAERTQQDEPQPQSENEEGGKAEKPNDSKSNSTPAAETDQSGEDPKSNSKKKTYATSMVGVKSAIEDDNFEAAQQTLRKIWRYFPPVVASPYAYSPSQKRVNGLSWPSQQTQTTPNTASAKTDEEPSRDLAAAELRARQRARGGLGSFVPQESKPRPKPTGAWDKLSEYPFGVSEMQRLIRSQLSGNRNAVQDPMLALLQARRDRLGDEAVFSNLLQQLNQGNLSEEVLAYFFTMVEENYERLDGSRAEVIDVLLQRLDLTNAQRASQLAVLCAKVGQFERAHALFRHCALLSSSGSPSFAAIVEQAKDCFEGEELMELGEAMFAASQQGPAERQKLLELRDDLLPAKEAATRSEGILENQLNADTPQQLQLAVAAQITFAKAGDDEHAEQCLEFVGTRVGRPIEYASNAYRVSVTTNSRAVLKLNRSDLIALFPESPDDYLDYGAWLQHASKVVSRSLNEMQPEFATELLLVIALRQCQLDQQQHAHETLSLLPPNILRSADQHHLLAIDVFRLAGAQTRALELEKLAYATQTLSHLRFGDLLQDTALVEGTKTAQALFPKLIGQSRDRDLFTAAMEIGKDDEEFTDEVLALQKESTQAERELEQRKEAAQARAEQRKLWRQEKQTQQGNAPPQPAPAAARLIPATPIRRIP